MWSYSALATWLVSRSFRAFSLLLLSWFELCFLSASRLSFVRWYASINPHLVNDVNRSLCFVQDFDRIEKSHQERKLNDTLRALRKIEFLATWKFEYTFCSFVYLLLSSLWSCLWC